MFSWFQVIACEEDQAVIVLMAALLNNKKFNDWVKSDNDANFPISNEIFEQTIQLLEKRFWNILMWKRQQCYLFKQPFARHFFALLFSQSSRPLSPPSPQKQQKKQRAK